MVSFLENCLKSNNDVNIFKFILQYFEIWLKILCGEEINSYVMIMERNVTYTVIHYTNRLHSLK